MKFENEDKFRRWICADLDAQLRPGWTVLYGKNVSDIILCRDDPIVPLFLFVEVKYHKKSHGRIGIGNASGKGYQPEVLLKKPLYLERYQRWIIADNDSEQCLFFSNDDVRQNCATEIKEGKQNNFTNGLFEKKRKEIFSITYAPKKIVEWARKQYLGGLLE